MTNFNDESVKCKSRGIPMQNFLHEVSLYEDAEIGTSQINRVNWTFVALLVGTTVVVIIIIIGWVLKHRMQCKPIDCFVGKHLAIVHDLKGVNEKKVTFRCRRY